MGPSPCLRQRIEMHKQFCERAAHVEDENELFQLMGEYDVGADGYVSDSYERPLVQQRRPLQLGRRCS